MGITYSIKGIKVSKFYKLIIGFFNIVISYISVFFASYLKDVISEKYANIFGAIILILIGTIILMKLTILRKKEDEYYLENSDSDNSKKIELNELFFITLALSMDNIFISISTVFSCGKEVFMLLPIIIGVIQYTLLSSGIKIGVCLKKIIGKYINENILNMISGLIFIILGIIRLI